MPERMPPVVLPDRYQTESEPVYNERVYRWRCWLATEPRPFLWYASENEVKAYKNWTTSNPIL